MVIIVVSYLKATKTRGSRYCARCVIGDNKYRAVNGYDYSLSSGGNNRKAALKLCYDLMFDTACLSAEGADLPGGGVGFAYTGEV